MKRQAARYILILVMLCVQAATLLGILASMRRNTEVVLSAHAQDVLEQVAVTVADQTLDYLSGAEEAAEVTASLLEDELLATDTEAALEEFLLSQLERGEGLSSLYVGRSDGSFVAVSRDAGGYRSSLISVGEAGREVAQVWRGADKTELRRGPPPEDGLERTYDPRERPWYQGALSGVLTWTEPYLFADTDQPGVTAALRLPPDNSGRVSVVGVDVTLGQLSSFLAGAEVSERGAAFVSDAYGFVLAHPRLPRLGEQLPKLEELEPNVTEWEPLEGEATSRAQSSSFERAGETYFASAVPLALKGATWWLTVQAPKADFVSGVASIYRRGRLEIVFISVLMGLIALPLAFGVSRPLATLYSRATTDELTGLMNRREFEQQAERLLSRTCARRANTVMAVLDLDHFKPVNDIYGHPIGDEVLRIVAKRFRQALRSGDLVARIGGDEFAFFLNRLGADEAAEVAERIRRVIPGRPIISSAGVHKLGATMGAVLLNKGESVRAALGRADEALISGKMLRKNQTYTALMTSAAPSASSEEVAELPSERGLQVN